MDPIRIGLGSQSRAVQRDALLPVVQALNTQMQRDAGPVWGFQAEVVLIENTMRVPRGVWPIIVTDRTPSMVGGLHTTDHDIPFALVLSSRNWALGASHECVEMAIDPTGNRMIAAPGLEIAGDVVKDTAETVHYLVEACDPIEDEDHAYTIDGVTVADFYTPHFFDAAFAAGVRYSFNGSLTRPREVKPNGYLSWLHPGLNRLQQLRHFAGPSIVTLPQQGGAGTAAGNSVREFVDRHTPTPRLQEVAARSAA